MVGSKKVKDLWVIGNEGEATAKSQRATIKQRCKAKTGRWR